MGREPTQDVNDRNFFSDENFGSFELIENEPGSIVRSAEYADWAPGPNEEGAGVRGRPVGDFSTLHYQGVEDVDLNDLGVGDE